MLRHAKYPDTPWFLESSTHILLSTPISLGKLGQFDCPSEYWPLNCLSPCRKLELKIFRSLIPVCLYPEIYSRTTMISLLTLLGNMLPNSRHLTESQALVSEFLLTFCCSNLNLLSTNLVQINFAANRPSISFL